MEKLKTKVTSPTTTEKSLEVEIPRERLTALFNEKVKAYSKELSLHGYRKGAVPKRVVAERFHEPITNESLEKLVENIIREVCEENKITPVGPGKVQELKNNEEGPILLKASVDVDMEIEFTDYKDLGVKVEKALPANDEQADKQINRYLQGMAKNEKIDGPGQKGNSLTGEYLKITIDGENQDLEKAGPFTVEIGSDKIKEFNEAFTGAKAGEEKEIIVKYPEDYAQKDLAGKEGYYKVKVKEIFNRVVPEPDDDLAKKFGYQDLKDMREKIKEEIDAQQNTSSRQKAEKDVIEKILERHPFDVPKSRIDQFTEYMMQQHQQRTGGAPVREGQKPSPEMEKEAEFILKRYKIIEQISKTEKIKAVKEELDGKIFEISKQYGMKFEVLKEQLRQSGRANDIRQEIKEAKTFNFLLGLRPEN